MSEQTGMSDEQVVPVAKQAHFPNPASRDRVMREHRNARWLEALALPLLTVGLILFFLAFPIVVVAIVSFSSATYLTFPPPAFACPLPGPCAIATAHQAASIPTTMSRYRMRRL